MCSSSKGTNVLQDGDEQDADEREKAAAMPAGSGKCQRQDPLQRD